MNAGNHTMLAMVFRRGRLPGLLLAVAAVAVVVAAPRAEAQTAFWTGVGGASWGGNGGTQNWSSTSATPGVPYTPVNGNSLRFFSNRPNPSSTNDLSGLSVAGISFQGATTNYTLNGLKLTLTGSITQGGSGAHTFNLPLELGNSSSIEGGTGSNVLTVNGDITQTGGTRGLNIQSGNVALYGSNSYSGNMIVGVGGASSLYINSLANTSSPQSLGQGSLVQLGHTSTNGTLIYNGSGGSTNKGFQISRDTGFSSGSGSFLNDGSGAVTWTGSQTLADSNTQPLVFTLGGTNTDNNTWQSQVRNNSATGTIAVTKTGIGKWILSGANTYTGATSVLQGVLLVDGSTAAGSAVSVSSSAVFGGNGTVSGNLSLSSGALFAFDTGSTLDLAGTLSLDSSFAVASLRNTSGSAVNWASVAQGTYTLMNTSFTFNTGNIQDFGPTNQVSVAPGKSAYFQQGSGPSSLQLVVVPEPAALSMAAVGVVISGLVARRLRRR